MIKKEKNRKDLFEEIGKKNGVSAEEVRKEMEKAIMEGYNNPDPEKRVEFRKRFGDGIPTLEEFIYILSKELRNDK